MVPGVTRPDFDDFVVARSSALLRVAYLLPHDSHLAEDLLQTSLTRPAPGSQPPLLAAPPLTFVDDEPCGSLSPVAHSELG